MNSNELKEQEEKQKTLENTGLARAAFEVVTRYASANKEFLVGYRGVDNETGQVLSKSLKSISESKLNPKYRDINVDQKAGFSAEWKASNFKTSNFIGSQTDNVFVPNRD